MAYSTATLPSRYNTVLILFLPMFHLCCFLPGCYFLLLLLWLSECPRFECPKFLSSFLCLHSSLCCENLSPLSTSLHGGLKGRTNLLWPTLVSPQHPSNHVFLSSYSDNLIFLKNTYCMEFFFFFFNILYTDYQEILLLLSLKSIQVLTTFHHFDLYCYPDVVVSKLVSLSSFLYPCDYRLTQ